MKPDSGHSGPGAAFPASMWFLELAWISVAVALALALFPASQNTRFALGLALIGLSFVQRWVATGRLSRCTVFDVPCGFLLVGAIVGLWVSYDRTLSLPTLLTFLGSIALYYAAANAPNPQILAKTAVLIGMAVATYFLTQYRYIPHPEKAEWASTVGMAISRVFPRVGSWDPFSNSVATLVEGLIPLSIGLAITSRSRAWRVVSITSVGLMGLATLITVSRGAWVALLAAGMLWLGSHWRRGILALLVAAAIALAALGGYLYFVRDAALSDIPGVGPVLYQLFARPDRLEIYQGSLYLIRDCPFTGIGLGRVFALVYSKYVLLIPHILRPYAHNLYLAVWLEHGLLGTVGMGWLLVAFGYLVIEENERGLHGLMFQAAWVGVVAILVHGLFDSLQYSDLWTMWPLYLLLGLVVSQSTARSRPAVDGRGWRWAVISAAVVLIGALVLRRPLAAMAWANLGAVKQGRAQLAEGLSDDRKASDLGAAAANYERALDLDPTNLTANLRLGVMAMDTGRYAEAVPYLETAFEVAPDSLAARKALGLAYVWVGNLDQAEPLLSDVPDIVKEMNTWGWWLGQQGQESISRNAYQMAALLTAE